MDEETLLAQELAFTISKFKRHGFQSSSYQGLRQSEYMLLFTLAHCFEGSSGGIKISDLSTKLNITPAGVTHMINSLEKDGYVERIPDDKDRRIVLVSPTLKGKKVIESMKEKFLESMKELVAFLGDNDSKELIRLLSKTSKFVNEIKCE